MRKSIDLSEQELKIIDDYQKENQIKNFSKAVRSFIRNKKCTCGEGEQSLSDENFALLADAIIKMDKKVDALVGTLAPKSAGEVS